MIRTCFLSCWMMGWKLIISSCIVTSSWIIISICYWYKRKGYRRKPTGEWYVCQLGKRQIFTSEITWDSSGTAVKKIYRKRGNHWCTLQRGEMMGVDYSTVSQGRKRLREKLQGDKHLSQIIKRVEVDLSIIRLWPLLPYYFPITFLPFNGWSPHAPKIAIEQYRE